jgi:ABC-2 type transport system permease protein
MTNRSWRTRALVELTLWRVREFVREPEALFWALAFPVIISTGLGVAFRNQPAGEVRVAATSPELAASLRQASRVRVEEMSAAQATDALRLGKVLLIVQPAPGGGVTYRYDDTNPDGRTARDVVDQAIQAAAGRADPVRAADDLVREAGSRYIDFVIPGLVGMGIMSNGLWSLGFSIVDARRRKLMKRIVATPMPRHLYLFSFLPWRMMLLVVEVGVPVGFGVIAFGVPLRGSIVDLTLISLVGSLAFSALGLLIASRARTIEAISGILNVVMMPMWILSGVFFSADRFPDAVQPFIRALPLTALVDALRANMLQGAGVRQLGTEMAVLGVCLVVSFVVALKLFRWR